MFNPRAVRLAVVLAPLFTLFGVVGCTGGGGAPGDKGAPINVVALPGKGEGSSVGYLGGGPEKTRLLAVYSDLAKALEPLLSRGAFYPPVCQPWGLYAWLDALVERAAVDDGESCRGTLKAFLPLLMARLKAADDFLFSDSLPQGTATPAKREPGPKIVLGREWALKASVTEIAQVVSREYLLRAPETLIPASLVTTSERERYADSVAAAAVALARVNDFDSATPTRALILDGALKSKVAIASPVVPFDVSAGDLVGDATQELFLSLGEKGLALYSTVTGQLISEWNQAPVFFSLARTLINRTEWKLLIWLGGGKQSGEATILNKNFTELARSRMPFTAFFVYNSILRPALDSFWAGALLTTGSIRLLNGSLADWCSMSGRTRQPTSPQDDRTGYRAAVTLRNGLAAEPNVPVVLGFDSTEPATIYRRCVGDEGYAKVRLDTELDLAVGTHTLLPKPNPAAPAERLPIGLGYRKRDQTLVTVDRNATIRPLGIRPEIPDAIAVVQRADTTETDRGGIVVLERGLLTVYHPETEEIVSEMVVPKRFNRVVSEALVDGTVVNRLILYQVEDRRGE